MKRHATSALALSLLLSACSGGGAGASPAGSGAKGSLRVLATDKPFDHSLVEEARVTVDRVRAHVESDAQSGFVELYDGAPFEVDLATLRNGVTRLLSSGDLPSGTYTQFRVHLTAGTLRLVNGNEYSTAAGTLKLTSQEKSGYKILLDPGVEVVAGEEETVMLDFDLTKTFKPVPASDPANAQRFMLQPNVRAAVMSRTGNISGTITGTAGLLDDAVIYVMSPGEDDPEQSIASTATDATGSAVVLGLPPGTYDLLVVHDNEQRSLYGLSVAAGSETGFELTF